MSQSRFCLLFLALLFAAFLVGCSENPTTPPGHENAQQAPIVGIDPRPWPEAPFITTYMGTGVAGLGSEDVPPREAQLSFPVDIGFAPNGSPYVVDWNNHRIRTVSKGLVRTVIGTGYVGEALDGPPAEVSLNHPTDVAFDSQGNLFLAAWQNSKVMKMEAGTEWIARICGDGTLGFSGDGGPAIDAILNHPVCVLPDRYGRVFITDEDNERVRVIDAKGVITTFAGNGEQGFAGDGGPAVDAEFNFPRGHYSGPCGHLAFDRDDNLYVADTDNNRIRRIDPGGIITTVAGNGVAGFSGDEGPATEAALKSPVDVAIGPDGNLYITDTFNHCIRVVDLATGIISTFAGSGGVAGSSGDGGAPRDALLRLPYGIGFDSVGNLYIADTINQKIRIVYR